MDDYGRHEVLHMAAFLNKAVNAELTEHPQVMANSEWKALAEQAAQTLWDLYQSVGMEHLADAKASAEAGRRRHAARRGTALDES